MKRFILWAVPVLLTASLPAWSATPDQPAASAAAPKPAIKSLDLFGDSVVAKGKGVEVKRGQLDEEVIRLKSQAALRGQNIPTEHMNALERQILDQIIQIQLLGAKATDAEKTSANETAQKKLDEAKNQLGSDESIDRRLKAEGLTREQLLSKWTEAATAEAVAKREMNVNITDADTKKFYDENPGKFEQPERVHVSHVLLSTKDPNDPAPDPMMKKDLGEEQKKAKHKQLEDILKRARAGEDFAKLAKEFSEDPGVKQNNGEYTFSREDPFITEFKAAAFSLNTNQVSDIVTTQYGYHIIKLLEKMPAKKLALSEVSTNIKDYLTAQEMQNKAPGLLAKMKKDASVEILDERLKSKDDDTATALPPGHPEIKAGSK